MTGPERFIEIYKREKARRARGEKPVQRAKTPPGSHVWFRLIQDDALSGERGGKVYLESILGTSLLPDNTMTVELPLPDDARKALVGNPTAGENRAPAVRLFETAAEAFEGRGYKLEGVATENNRAYAIVSSPAIDKQKQAGLFG